MPLTADLYFSFRSPYSYLAVGRYRAMTETYDLDIALRPVYPLAIREPDFFERNHPNWLRYTFTDMFRVAQYHGIPFGPPRPDPIVQNVMTREIAAEQPYIYRLTRLGQGSAFGLVDHLHGGGAVGLSAGQGDGDLALERLLRGHLGGGRGLGPAAAPLPEGPGAPPPRSRNRLRGRLPTLVLHLYQAEGPGAPPPRNRTGLTITAQAGRQTRFLPLRLA